MSDKNNQKMLQMQRLLNLGLVRFIFDGTHDSIDKKNCPAHLLSTKNVIFEIGYDISIPIKDLLVDDFGFSGTLSFKGIHHKCVIPWEAIYSIYSYNSHDHTQDIVYNWFDDMPFEVKAMLDEDGVASALPKIKQHVTVKSSAPNTKKRELPPYLRVVK